MAETIWVQSDPVILRLGRYEFSPFSNTANASYQTR
jgi:hypothetical protein